MHQVDLSLGSVLAKGYALSLYYFIYCISVKLYVGNVTVIDLVILGNKLASASRLFRSVSFTIAIVIRVFGEANGQKGVPFSNVLPLCCFEFSMSRCHSQGIYDFLLLMHLLWDDKSALANHPGD